MQSSITSEGKKMKAVFEGFISVEKNSVFSVQYKYAKKILEVRDGINTDSFTIGKEYEICEAMLKNA